MILHVEGYSVKGLRNVTNLIAKLGSLMVEHLGPTSIWTWAFVSGGKTMFEKIVERAEKSLTQKAYGQIIIPLSDVPMIHSDEKIEKMRWEFCSNYGVMGDICDENKPANLNFSYLENYENPALRSVPVIITAGTRGSYLYQSLKSFLNASGVIKDNFYVLLGTPSESVIDLLELLNIKFSYIPPLLYKRNRFASFQFYKKVYQFASIKYSKKQYVIFLEEDVEVSQDFFFYISQTLRILQKDPTLYCITGHSTTGLKRVAHDESVLLRANVQVGWGYAVPMSLIKKVLAFWPNDKKYDDSLFDKYIYTITNKKKLECIMPEVSRSFHFGIGINTNFQVQEIKNSAPLVSSYKQVKFKNVNRLELSLWREDFYKKISQAIPTKISPCRENYLETLQAGSYVMYYNFSLADKTTYFNFISLGNCFQTWTFSEQGQHESVATISVSLNITFYLVAVPDSPYAKLKPKDYDIIDMRYIPLEDRNIYRKTENYLASKVYNDYKNFSLPGILSLFS